jgi:hypothetical protein
MFITSTKAIENKEHLTRALVEVVGETDHRMNEEEVRYAFDNALDKAIQRYFNGNTIWKARNYGR